MNTKTGTENRLLAARGEGLKYTEGHSLRPLGKLWGMDVFSWYRPSSAELSATISTFPFPVFWMADSKQVNMLAAADPEVMQSLAWCAQFDDAQLTVPGNVLAPMQLFTATETLADSLKMLRQVRKERHILLFTVEGTEWKTNMEAFEAFVRLNSNK